MGRWRAAPSGTTTEPATSPSGTTTAPAPSGPAPSGPATTTAPAPSGPVGSAPATSTSAARPLAAGRLDVWIVAGLLALTLLIGVVSSEFTGLPKGGDALGHAATVAILMRDFPHLLWNPTWFGGLPSVPGLYPPGYTLMVAAVAVVTGGSVQHAMVFCAIATYFVMVATLYGFVWIVARSRTAAILAALLVLAVPAFWEPSLQVGEYPRLTAMGFACLATFLAALYTTRPSRLRFTATALAVGLALATHPITGGLGALQVLGVLLFVPYRPLRDRLGPAAAAAALTVGLGTWLYLPSLVGTHAYYLVPQPTLMPSTGTSFGYLLYPGSHTLTAFSPLLLPLALVLFALAAFQVWRRRSPAAGQLAGPLGASLAMLVSVACVLGYAYVGRLDHANVELIGIYPQDMFSYAAWPLAAVSAVLVPGLLSAVRGAQARLWRLRALAGAYAAAIVCLAALTPVVAGGAFDYHSAAAAEVPLLPGSGGTQQYRIGLTDTTESSWVNVYTATPEIGGPFTQGALNLNYVDWSQKVLTTPSSSASQVQFVAQWNSIRWIEAQQQYGVYRSDPGAFRYVGASTDPTYLNYEVRSTIPVLAPTDAPPMLVIGPGENYSLVLDALADADIGPSRVIPVQGSAYIDDYTLAQLEQFPVVLLYGFEAHDAARAAHLLAAYVHAGGGIVAEVSGDAGLATQLAADGAPLPVTSWTAGSVDGSWHFAPSWVPVLRGIDLAAFSPALYAGADPWGVETAQATARRSSVVLASFGRPLIADEQVGDALVVESGMNLPYHIATFANATESSLLGRLVASATARWWPTGHPTGSAVVLAADSDRLQVGPAGGVLFTEADTPDWHATVDGHGAVVYPAGLGYMYVPLDATPATATTVVFRYQLSALQWAAIVVSVLTVLLLLAYLLGVSVPRPARARLGGLRRRLARWVSDAVAGLDLPLADEPRPPAPSADP